MAAGAWLAPIRSSGVLELDRYSLFLRGGHAPAAPFSSGRLSRALYSFTATRRRSRAGFGRGIRQCLGDVGTHVSEMPSIISRSMVRMPRSPPNRRLDRSTSVPRTILHKCAAAARTATNPGGEGRHGVAAVKTERRCCWILLPLKKNLMLAGQNSNLAIAFLTDKFKAA